MGIGNGHNMFQNATHRCFATEDNAVCSLIAVCMLPPESALPICASSNEANSRLKKVIHEDAQADGRVRNLCGFGRGWQAIVGKNDGQQRTRQKPGLCINHSHSKQLRICVWGNIQTVELASGNAVAVLPCTRKIARVSLVSADDC